MDLGIRGRVALVGGASKGLGRACAEALAQNGADVVIVARNEEKLRQVAREISDRSAVRVSYCACDITSDDGIRQVLDVCPNPDILVTNAGGPPPGDFRDWSRDVWIQTL